MAFAGSPLMSGGVPVRAAAKTWHRTSGPTLPHRQELAPDRGRFHNSAEELRYRAFTKKGSKERTNFKER